MKATEKKRAYMYHETNRDPHLGGWVCYDGSTNQAEIWEQLARDLMNAKMFHTRDITKITTRNYFDGTRGVIVYRGNGYRTTYDIPER